MKNTLFNKVTLLSAEKFKLILKYLRLKITSLMLFLNVVKKFLNYRNFRKSLSKIIQNIYKGSSQKCTQQSTKISGIHFKCGIMMKSSA